VVDLMAALKESLAQTKKPAGSEKGTERQPAEQPKTRRSRG
jgi:non-homologous end joining protein Ku